MAVARSRDLIVGIDAGTSMIKTVAFTRDGRQLGESALPNSYSASAGGRVEQDMARTWKDMVTAIRGLAAAVPDLAARAARQLPARGRWPAHRFGDQLERQREDVV